MPKMRFFARPGEEPPKIGEFMRSRKPRVAYKVVGLTAGRIGFGGGRVWRIELERYSLADIPPDAEFFQFQWFKRAPKGT